MKRRIITLEQALRRVLLPHQIFGQFPLKIKNAEVTLSKVALLVSALIVVVLLAVLGYLLRTLFSQLEPIFVLINLMEYMPSVLLFTVSPIWLSRSRAAAQQMVDCLADVASFTTPVYCDVDSYVKKGLITLVTMVVVSANRWYAVIVYANPGAHYVMAAHSLRSLLLLSTTLPFVGLCHVISSSFRDLENTLKSSIGIPGLEAAARGYEKIALASAALEKMYSPQILMIVSVLFFELNFSVYISIVIHNYYYVHLSFSLWGLQALWMIWWLVATVDLIRKRADDFYVKYQARIRRSGLHDYVPFNATLYIFALKRSKIQFSGCGFFTMDRKLLLSMCLATTTYVVMLKSFQ